jgi:hypothetical protein
MSDNKFPDISVGSFAMDILKDMAKDPTALKPALKESTLQSAQAPDISKVRVSEDFVAKVTGQKTSNKVKITESSQGKLINLIEELSGLIKEAKVLLNEMTSVGNIGCGTSKTNKRSKLLANRIKSRLTR